MPRHHDGQRRLACQTTCATGMTMLLKSYHDVLIAGAGPAGMAAAPSDASIAVIDDNPRPGGQFWRNGSQVTLPRGAHGLRLHSGGPIQGNEPLTANPR